MNQLYSAYKEDILPFETVTPFTNSKGFSLVAPYQSDDHSTRKMFLKIFLDDEDNIGGSVSMVREPDDDSMPGYPLANPEQGQPYVTNFSLSKDDGFSFNEGKILNEKYNKTYTVSEFIELIKANHQRDRTKLQRLRMYSARTLLIILFWLADSSYADVEYDTLLRSEKYKEIKGLPKERLPDPLFKYFFISKNVLFVATLAYIVVFALAKYGWQLVDEAPQLTDGFFMANLMLATLLADKFTQRVDREISLFFKGDSCHLKKMELIALGFKVKPLDLIVD